MGGRNGSPSPLVYILSLFLFMREACNTDCDHKDYNANYTKLPKLTAAQQAYEWKLCQGKETKAKTNNITSICHATMPGIASTELAWGSNI